MAASAPMPPKFVAPHQSAGDESLRQNMLALQAWLALVLAYLKDINARLTAGGL